jgi:hypothetical protein
MQKADSPSQIECAPCSQYRRAVKFLMTIHTELKKRPRCTAPAKSQGSQCGKAMQMSCMSALSSRHLSLINTCARIPISVSPMSSPKLRHADGVAPANDISSASPDSTSAAANKTGTAAEILRLCSSQSRRRGRRHPPRARFA